MSNTEKLIQAVDELYEAAQVCGYLPKHDEAYAMLKYELVSRCYKLNCQEMSDGSTIDDCSMVRDQKYEFSEDFNEVYRNRPEAPVSDTECQTSIVYGQDGKGIRCVYVNNRRIVGGKPYVSEGLKSVEKTCTIADVLDAFSDEQLRAYLAEKKARHAYFAAYHEWRKSQQITV